MFYPSRFHNVNESVKCIVIIPKIGGCGNDMGDTFEVNAFLRIVINVSLATMEFELLRDLRDVSKSSCRKVAVLTSMASLA